MATSVVTIALCHPRRGWSLGLLGNTTTIFCPRVSLVSVTRPLWPDCGLVRFNQSGRPPKGRGTYDRWPDGGDAMTDAAIGPGCRPGGGP